MSQSDEHSPIFSSPSRPARPSPQVREHSSVATQAPASRPSTLGERAPRNTREPFLAEPWKQARGRALAAAARAALDAHILEILRRTALPGEPMRDEFARKETELRTLFAGLSPQEALALHARLERAPIGEDPVAVELARLTLDRRHRLLAFLADARRRNALATARRR